MLRPYIRWALVLTLIFGLADGASAQSGGESPEDVAMRLASAMRASDWAASARLMHPDALAQLKRMFGPLVAAEATKELGARFFRVGSSAEFEQLSGAEAFERLMGALAGQVPELKVAMGSSEMKVLGHVREEPDLAHVVYRMAVKVEDITVTKMAVMTLKREGEGWRAMLSGEIEGMAQALTRLGRQPRQPENAPPKARTRARSRRRS